MLRVYLAGPIFGRTDAECSEWRTALKESGLRVEWIDPMDRDFRGKEDMSVSQIVEGDKSDVNDASFVVAKVDGPPSVGTSMEILFAWERRIPVIAIVGARCVSPWIRYHTHTVETIGDAIDALRTRLG